MLITPSQIHQVLKEPTASLTKGPDREGRPDRSALGRLLENANLSPAEVLEHVSILMRSGENDQVKLGAAKVGLELNGLLGDEENAKRDFTVNINIVGAVPGSINQILIPRI